MGGNVGRGRVGGRPRDRETLRIGTASRVLSLDPRDMLDFDGLMVQRQIFETLYVVKAGAIQARLAAALPRAGADAGDYEIDIAAGHRFSDGTELDARAVVEALSACPQLSDRMSFSAEGPVLRVHLKGAESNLARALAKPWSAVFKQVEGKLLGTGPWCALPPRNPQQRMLTLEANPHHAGARPGLRRLEFIDFPQGADALPRPLIWALQRGDVDLTIALAAHLAAAVHWMHRVARPGSSTALFWINSERIQDVDHRSAILQAIDREALVAQALLDPSHFRGRCVLPPGLSDFDDQLRFDPAASAEQLADVPGLARVMTMLVIWAPRAYLTAPMVWAQRLAANLEAAGLQVKIEQTRDPADYQRRLRSGDYDFVLGGWSADTEDAYDFVHAVYGPDMVPQPDDQMATGCNFARLRDPELGRSIEALGREPDGGALARALQLGHAHRGVIGLAYGAATLVHARALKGLEVDAAGVPHFAACTWGASIA